MDAPPILSLVDRVHAFNGVVVEQFEKRVENILSDSIRLWRLLKLLIKILQLQPQVNMLQIAGITACSCQQLKRMGPQNT